MFAGVYFAGDFMASAGPRFLSSGDVSISDIGSSQVSVTSIALLPITLGTQVVPLINLDS